MPISWYITRVGTRGWHMDTYKWQQEKWQNLNSRAQKMGPLVSEQAVLNNKPQTHRRIINPNNHCLYTEACRLKWSPDLRNTLLKNKASFVSHLSGGRNSPSAAPCPLSYKSKVRKTRLWASESFISSSNPGGQVFFKKVWKLCFTVCTEVY